MNPFKFLLIALVFAIKLKAQGIVIRYDIETTFNGKDLVTFDQNFGVLQFNAASNDLTFTTNLANFKTGSKRMDSLLLEKEKIQFTFQGNVDSDLFKIIKEENDDKYHKIIGTILVNNISYPSEAFVRIDNFSDKSNPNKSLLDLKLEVDPKVIVIPYLSDYFKKPILFLVNDGIIMK